METVDGRVKPGHDDKRASEPQLAEPGVVVRATPLVLIRARPVELTVRLIDADIVDAGLAALHQALGVEFPLLVAMAAIPLAAVVMRSEEHTSELQSLMRISYAVHCLKKHK